MDITLAVLTKLATENNAGRNTSPVSLIGTKWEAAARQQWNLKPLPLTTENYKIVSGCEVSQIMKTWCSLTISAEVIIT